MTEVKHTPLPWNIISETNIVSEKGRLAASAGGYSDNFSNALEENMANAAFIVRACNNHYNLLEALKACSAFCANYKHSHGEAEYSLKLALAAIAAAGKVGG